MAVTGMFALWIARVEQTALDIAYMKTADTGPLRLAIREGYFEAAGIDDVDLIAVDSGREAADLLKAGMVDLAYATYVPFIRDGSVDADSVRFVSGASECAPGSCLLVALPNSKAASLKDLTNARIAVTDEGTISDALVLGTFVQNHVDPRRVTFVKVAFDDMENALRTGRVNAAFVTEPYLSHMQTRPGGIKTILDVASGKLKNMPSAAYAATREFVDHNPNTIAAFRRIIHEAVGVARKDWRGTAQIVGSDAQIAPGLAMSAARLNMVSAVELDKVQRVSNLMTSIGSLRGKFDVRNLYLPLQPPRNLAVGPNAGLPTTTVAVGACRGRRGRHRSARGR